MHLSQSLSLYAFVVLANASPRSAVLEQRATSTSSVSRSGTATVNLATHLGTPAFLANGVHNGIPPNSFSSYVAGTPASTAAVQTQIPNAFFSGIKLQNARGGQGNLPNPAQGWTYGLTQYKNRFRAFYSDYLTVRQFGANYTLMLGDVFGQLNSSSVFPGDNGDWSLWDAYIDQITADLVSNQITTGLDVELWNEADLQWTNQTRFLQFWGRGYYQLRSKLPSSIRIVGPGFANPPNTGSDWTGYLNFIASNGSIPDAYTYHHLGSGSDPAVNYPIFQTALSSRNLPTRPIYANEFGAPAEQSASYDVWFISRFERLNMWGNRANWESTSATTDDYLANTLAKSGTTYTPNGSWQVKSYYANMTGTRVATVASADGNFDTFAVISGTGIGSTKLITGSHGTTNPYLIEVKGLAAQGYPSSGSITVTVRQFQWSGLNTTVPAPGVYGTVKVSIVNDSISIGTTASGTSVAYAFEF